MPHYQLPELKEEAVEKVDCDESYPARWDREVRFPVNAAILKEAVVGEDMEITVKGKVIEVSSDERENGKSRMYVQVRMESIDAYGVNEYTELAEDD